MFISRLLSLTVSAVIFASPVTSPAEPLPELSAESYAVVELHTMTVLAEHNADTVRPMGHTAKLMTVLIAAQMLSDGSLALEEAATASPTANAQQGAQIWLETGDKITVGELLRSVIVGNANDACVCLAEHISGTAEKHVELLNETAAAIGMSNTHFADCTGMSPETVSTALDTAIMFRELVKYKDLTGYFTTWLDELDSKEVQLVSNDRLVRSYKGIVCQKVSACESSGECQAVAAERGELTVCVAAYDCADREKCLSQTASVLDGAFQKYRLFEPDISADIPKKLTVVNGQKPKLRLAPEEQNGVLTAVGTAADAEAVVELPEDVTAPVKKGQHIGNVTYKNGDITLLTVGIVAAETVGKADLAFGVKRSLLNLLSF